MATINIVPSAADGTYNQWGWAGSPSKHGVLDPANADGFSGGYNSMGNISTDYQGFAQSTMPPYVSISAWTIWIAGGKNANGAQTYFGLYDKTVGWLAGPTASWFNVFIWSSQSFSQAWTPVDSKINNANVILLMYNTDGDGTHPSYVDVFYSAVTYTPAGGSFMPILSLAASAIGSGLALSEMPKLAAYLRRFNNWFDPGEEAAALREWREYRHPAWSFR